MLTNGEKLSKIFRNLKDLRERKLSIKIMKNLAWNA
jgi:hypothetical protein